MGTTLWVHAAAGPPEPVRDAIVAWNRARGFDRVDETLPVPDEEHERVGLLFSTARWTGLVWSRFEELERLEFELHKLPPPTLTLWVYDSDAWGWKLWKDRRWVAAFSSHPDYEDVPAGVGHDRGALCAVADADPKAVAAAEKQRGIFAENAVVSFARAIGLFPPKGAWLPSVDEHDLVDDAAVRTEVLRFRRAGWDPVGTFDVRTLRFHPVPGPQLDPAAVRALAEAHLPPGFHWQLALMRLLFWPLGLLVRVVGWVMGLAFRLRGGPPAQQVPWRRDGDRLRNDRWGLSVALPEGAEPARIDLGGHALAFHLAGGDFVSFTGISAQAARARQTMGMQGSTYDVVDLEVGSWPARRVVFTPPDPQQPPAWLIFVVTPRFVVVGHGAARTPERVAELDALVLTLELTPPSARPPGSPPA